MARTERLIEIFAAAGLAVVAFVISPPGISLLTGRGDLPFRINAVSLVIDLFLVAVSAALLTRGRARGACFYAVACAFPLALLGGLEAAAIYVRLADRIAPLEDTSLLANLDRKSTR